MLTQFTLPHVETYFGGLIPDPWQTVGDVASVTINIARSSVVVALVPVAGFARIILVELPHAQVVRLRFDPQNQSEADYPEENSRTIVMDTMSELRNGLGRPTLGHQQITAGGVVTGDEVIVSD